MLLLLLQFHSLLSIIFHYHHHRLTIRFFYISLFHWIANYNGGKQSWQPDWKSNWQQPWQYIGNRIIPIEPFKWSSVFGGTNIQCNQSASFQEYEQFKFFANTRHGSGKWYKHNFVFFLFQLTNWSLLSFHFFKSNNYLENNSSFIKKYVLNSSMKQISAHNQM